MGRYALRYEVSSLLVILQWLLIVEHQYNMHGPLYTKVWGLTMRIPHTLVHDGPCKLYWCSTFNTHCSVTSNEDTCMGRYALRYEVSSLLVILQWLLNVEHQYNMHGPLCTKVWGLTMRIPHTLVYNGPCMLYWCSTFNTHCSVTSNEDTSYLSA
jgi:hypothetical protein